jgi:hypothetical protein
VPGRASEHRGDWSWHAQRGALADIAAAYGDLESPGRQFVRRFVADDPYREFVLELRASAREITDDTDINSEVCFTYIVQKPIPLVVKLSMVGEYALLRRAPPRSEPQPIESADDCHDEGERRIWRVIARHRFRVLTDDLLARPVPLALPDHDSVTLYQALFEPEYDDVGADSARRRPLSGEG